MKIIWEFNGSIGMITTSVKKTNATSIFPPSTFSNWSSNNLRFPSISAPIGWNRLDIRRPFGKFPLPGMFWWKCVCNVPESVSPCMWECCKQRRVLLQDDVQKDCRRLEHHSPVWQYEADIMEVLVQLCTTVYLLHVVMILWNTWNWYFGCTVHINCDTTYTTCGNVVYYNILI